MSGKSKEGMVAHIYYKVFSWTWAESTGKNYSCGICRKFMSCGLYTLEILVELQRKLGKTGCPALYGSWCYDFSGFLLGSSCFVLLQALQRQLFGFILSAERLVRH